MRRAGGLRALIAIALLVSSGAPGAELAKPGEAPGAQSCTVGDRDRCAADAARCYRDCSLLESCSRACCLALADCLSSHDCQSGYPACAR